MPPLWVLSMQMTSTIKLATESRKIAAVDFDGTLRSYKGDPVDGSKRGMRWLDENGYDIVIWTCSDRSDQEIMDWLSKHGYPKPRAINQEVSGWQTHSPKIVAQVYIDDRGIGWQGWRSAIRSLEYRHDNQSRSVV
jgi:hypothetical protein